ncbi:MAG: hypothetical protein QXV95_07975 [Sulfolobales archaeon]
MEAVRRDVKSSLGALLETLKMWGLGVPPSAPSTSRFQVGYGGEDRAMKPIEINLRKS